MMIFLVTRMILKMTFSSLSLNLPFYDKSNGDGYDDDDDNYNYTEYHNDDNDCRLGSLFEALGSEDSGSELGNNDFFDLVFIHLHLTKKI